MDRETLKLMNNINRAIIKCRGIYSAWSVAHGISYHEMLVLYTIREYGFCTQKQICDSYLLPKQTIHNVISSMRENGILIYDEKSSRNRQKAFVLTDKGREYAADFLKSLDAVEDRAIELLGGEKLHELTNLLFEFDSTLNAAAEEER